MLVMDGPPEPSEQFVPEGFAGQRMLVLPRPAVQALLSRPVTDALVVTDAGYFPHASFHGRSRPEGSRECILMVCTGGSGWLHTDGSRTSVRRGDAVVIPARLAHEYGASQSDPWTLWWFHFAGPNADSLATAAVAGSGGHVSHLREASAVASLVSQIIDAVDEGTAGGFVRAAGAAWHALSLVITTGRRSPGPTLSPVERAVEHLRSTAPRRTSVEELAGIVGLSTSQLNALFRQQVGVPPLRYQSDLRMARARELLVTSDLTVAAIAKSCGYDDPLYFSRHFSRIHGTSPTAFRSRPQ